MKAISNNKNIHSLWDVKEIGEKPQKKKKGQKSSFEHVLPSPK
jgi:hypothetical protein